MNFVFKMAYAFLMIVWLTSLPSFAVAVWIKVNVAFHQNLSWQNEKYAE